MNQFYKKLKDLGRVRVNEPLSKHTTFHIGGPARFLIEVEETEKIVALLNFLSAEGIEYYILGGGSNLLMSDEGFDGVVIKIRNSKFIIHNLTIEAEAGVQLGLAVNLASQNNLTGLEWATGIPGTIGGAVRGNAGAMGSDISKSVESVKVWRDGEVAKLSKDECGFGYRETVFKRNGDAILGAVLRLAPGDKVAILKKMQEYLDLRNEKHPRHFSAGSFFKNVKISSWRGNAEDLPKLYLKRGVIPAAWLIEQAGLKGYQAGGALIAFEHCNFIVNTGAATQSEILTAVEEARNRVYNRFGIMLEAEVEVVK